MIEKIIDFMELLDFNRNISNMKIADFFDILMVSFIVYMFLKWIKDTRAWSLIKGIFLLIIIWEIFRFFKLYTMAYIIDKIFNDGFIVAIVLFQPEIRRALEQLGKSRFILDENKTNSEVNNEIIRAVRVLSSEMTGALICIEQNIPIGDYEKTGILINAVASSQLLINIFVDKTPLHDGAVIIRKGKIAAAGCILPVTTQEIGKELGTRHRAAVGLSEVCDSIIIVVSEETGAVSVAKSGKLKKDIQLDELTAMLENTIETEKTSIFSLLRRINK